MLVMGNSKSGVSVLTVGIGGVGEGVTPPPPENFPRTESGILVSSP